ncbi:phosphonate ABC transporter, ATP-binding protein [Gemella haemolysans]|uniref:Phosphonate ABC transporter, ATP-binding protein n=1 Tax=Gemella haemolysans TaxID=1379 RepID=A0A134A082_9BACL|nr:phosphonate ABC transporter ATP-binding protein [Gemella haemolysans]KXB61091.1 phosphonate ABC transporter, ATP-binding protein [Gemella haemolysans]
MNSERLEVKNLIFNYGVKNILNDISFEVPNGDFVAIVGKSGAGKSTLLRCLNLLNKPQSGEIIITGENIVQSNRTRLKRIRRDIAFIFQDYNVLDNLYTVENVLTPYLVKKSVLGLLLGYTKKEYNEGVDFLKQVGLEDEAFKKSKYLSGGQKQRVAIAKALAQNPKILLADEPVSSLDEKNTTLIMDTFKKLNEENGITVLINLHDVNLAKKYSTKILGLKDGKVLFYKDSEKVTKDEFEELYN